MKIVFVVKFYPKKKNTCYFDVLTKGLFCNAMNDLTTSHELRLSASKSPKFHYKRSSCPTKCFLKREQNPIKPRQRKSITHLLDCTFVRNKLLLDAFFHKGGGFNSKTCLSLSLMLIPLSVCEFCQYYSYT